MYSIEKKNTYRINKKSAEVLEVKINTEIGARKFKSKQKKLLKDWKSILNRYLVITSSNTKMFSFNTKSGVVEKVEDAKWKYSFTEIESTVDDQEQLSDVPNTKLRTAR